jgi:diaminopimelate decarboxylase
MGAARLRTRGRRAAPASASKRRTRPAASRARPERREPPTVPRSSREPSRKPATTGTLGILLAGGRGERLGMPVPKALVEVGGRTLLARALACLAAVCDELRVALPAGFQLELPAQLEHQGRALRVRRVEDPPEAAGPLAGLVAALGGEPFDRAVVLGVDHPLARPEALRFLLGRLESPTVGDAGEGVERARGARIAVVPAPHGMPQPLVAAYAPAAGALLREALRRGERSLVRAVRSLEPMTLGNAELARMPGGLDNFLDVDTPEALAEVERRLGDASQASGRTRGARGRGGPARAPAGRGRGAAPVRAPAGLLELGGVPLDRAFRALQALEPHAHAFYLYDLDQVRSRAARARAAFAPLRALCAFALKANALPALLEGVAAEGLGADAASLGELELAAAAGFGAERRVLNGNGKTMEEIDWAARHGVHSVNADHVAELDALERAAAAHGRGVRVALRVNPGIATRGHRYVATGDETAKFGVAPAEALEAWAARARWPHLKLDGVHLHVGSQLHEPAPLTEACEVAVELARESERRGAPLGLVNLGGGFGVQDSTRGAEFPIESYAERLLARVATLGFDWVFEPGRWLVAPAGVLVAEVLWVKHRDGRRFVVLGAGMNDLLRPALYGARHPVVPVAPRAGARAAAIVVGPVCESGDVLGEVELPPVEPGDLVAILDTGAYGAVMASNYNGRGRLAELVAEGGRLVRARPGEAPRDLVARRSADELTW